MAQTEEVFDDVARNGTPRTKLDRLKTVAPRLYANIINARVNGEVFKEDGFEYNIVPDDKYGDTVYKNTPRKKWQKGAAKIEDLKPKQEKLDVRLNDRDQFVGTLDAHGQVLDSILSAITNLESAVGVLNNKVEAVRGKLMGPDKAEFRSGLEQLKNDHGNENQGPGTERAYVEVPGHKLQLAFKESAENQDYSGEGDGLDAVVDSDSDEVRT